MSVLGSRSVTSAYSASNNPETQRPTFVRRETDHILSYYQSEDAGRSYGAVEQRYSPSPRRRRSSDSSSVSSNYSVSDPSLENNSSNNDRFDYSSAATSPIQRRTSNHSSGGSDKRRIAVVEMDTEALDVLDDSFKGAHISQSALLTRRGIDGYRIGSLALISAPDVTPGSYDTFEPPMSAPAVDHKLSRAPLSDEDHEHTINGHQRSQSEAVKLGRLQKKSSRDVGIVGTVNPTSPTRMVDARSRSGGSSYSPTAEPSPIFQTPSPSTHSAANFHRAYSATEVQSSSVPLVAVPNRVAQSRSQNSDSEQVATVSPIRPTWSSSSSHHRDMNGTPISLSPYPGISSPYLYYQPGLHAAAGPLPDPPRQVLSSSADFSPPPRPARVNSPTLADRTSLKQSLKLPDKVAAALARRANSLSDEHSETNKHLSGPSDRDCRVDGVSQVLDHHSREAAFSGTSSTEAQNPTSSVVYHEREFPKQAGSNTALSTANVASSIDVTLDNAPPLARSNSGNSAKDLGTPTQNRNVTPQREASWYDYRSELGLAEENLSSVNLSKALPDPIYRRNDCPTKPYQLDAHLQPLDINSKRFSSLPRTPSVLSVTRSSLYADQLDEHQNLPPTRIRSATKIKSRWPEPMHFADVLIKKNSHDRSMGYAQKIAEFANYDAGLLDWVVATKRALANPRPMGKRASLSSDVGALEVKHRHSSRNSISSEVTFPRRMDALAATDLSMRPSEEEVPEGPPALPYPALAQSPRISPSKVLGGLAANLSTRSVPSSITANRTLGGVFASIGRKASLRRQQSVSDSSPPKLLGRRQAVATAPRPIHISTTPTVMGGPRAPPGRVQRSQSTTAHPPNTHEHIMVVAPPSHVTPKATSALKRSSSVNPTECHSAPVINELAFESQMERLADLLPHVDKKILAVYLRRTGQDVVAVGQYLEDERNGNIRTE